MGRFNWNFCFRVDNSANALPDIWSESFSIRVNNLSKENFVKWKPYRYLRNVFSIFVANKNSKQAGCVKKTDGINFSTYKHYFIRRHPHLQKRAELGAVCEDGFLSLEKTSENVYFSSRPSCYQFVMKQSVGDMIVTPYVVAFTSCTLWLFYGYIIGDVNIMRVNIIGTGLQFSYTICYYLFSSKKGQVRKQVNIGFCIIITSVAYTYFETDFKRLVTLFGFFCSCVTVAFFASPLANMHYVIKVWNSESLPRLLICATFIVSVQWALYGYIIDDIYILITNLLGTILSAVQLSMLLIIPRESSPKLISAI